MTLAVTRIDDCSGEFPVVPAVVLGSTKDVESMCVAIDTELSKSNGDSIIDADHYDNNNNHYMFRLYVRPFTLFSSNAVTPIRYLKHYSIYIPRHVVPSVTLSSPLLRSDYNNTDNTINEDDDYYYESYRMNDEWNDIWSQCRIFIRQGTLIQAVKQENLVSVGLLLTIITCLYIGLFSGMQLIDFSKLIDNDSSEDGHLILLLIDFIVTAIAGAIVFYFYTKYGSANISSINEQRKRLALKGFALTLAIWIFFLINNHFSTEESNHFFHVTAVATSSLSSLVLVIGGVYYRRRLVDAAADKGQHDEALQNVHDEIKCISNALHYFVLQPTVRHDKSDIAVDVSFKNNDGSEISQLPLPTLNSISMSTNAVTAKRRGRNVEMV